MRRILFGLGVALGLGLLASPARAQVGAGVFADPFSFYYGYFVPNQALQASIPRAEDTVRMYSAARQYNALTERAGLYDPIGSLGDGYDPLGAFGSANGVSRLPMTRPQGVMNMNINGSGPAGYYNRVNTHFPTLRTGRGSNRSLAPVVRSPRAGNFRGGGGFNLPTATSGMGGPS